MSNDEDEKRSKKASLEESAAKAPVMGANGKPVGRSNPPKHAQFKKGQRSPNPRGRPKGRSKQNQIDKILQRKITITIDGNRQRVAIEEAMTMAHIKKALAGDTRAFAAVMKVRTEMDRILGVQGPTPEETLKAKEDERAREALAAKLVKDIAAILDGLAKMKKSGVVEMAGGKWTLTKPGGRFSALRERRRRGIELSPEELAAITAWEAYEQLLDDKSALR